MEAESPSHSVENATYDDGNLPPRGARNRNQRDRRRRFRCGRPDRGITHVFYENYDLEPPDSRAESPSYSAEITADVTTLDLQYERDDGGFEFRLLGDRDELTRVRIADDEWDLN